MMTVLTNVTVREGAVPEWDRIMTERLRDASHCNGWIRGALLMPLDGMNQRVIVGTWHSRADWEAWHQDPAFTDTATRLDALQTASAGPHWHEVVADAKRQPALALLRSTQARAKAAMTQLANRKRTHHEAHSVAGQ